MKITISLRLYFFASMLLLSSIMAAGFSVLSDSYYIDGLDRGLKGVMLKFAQTVELENEKPKTIMDFTIASQWQDLPNIIQQRFTPPTDIGVLYKNKEQHPIFSMPKDLYFVAYFTTPDGKPRYVSHIMLEENREKSQETSQHTERLVWIITTGVFAILLFALFLLMIMRKITKPVESLRSWAKSLNHTNVQKVPPDFTYSELNTLATLIRTSLISAHDSLTREQQFLSYASHELRTPISVIRSNVELLKRLSEKNRLTDKQNSTLNRIERAGLTMSDLINTLLWLSRKDSVDGEPEQLNLHDKISSLTSELAYLLNGKQVEVVFDNVNENVLINTQVTACHIVLTNLIRNAYQHTQNGIVEISQQGSKVTIININQRSNEETDNTSNNKSNTGYGLGLQLIERIINRHNWFYQVSDTQARYKATVDFSDENRSRLEE